MILPENCVTEPAKRFMRPATDATPRARVWVLDHLVSYEMDAIPGDGQSPPAECTIPGYVLPAPTKGAAGNLTISMCGTSE